MRHVGRKGIPVLLVAFLLVGSACLGCAGDGDNGNEPEQPDPLASYSATRFVNNPIITKQMFIDAGIPDDGDNINGPSLIRVPDWLPDKLGTYYLYFGHHEGKYIRLAYVDNLEGSWTLYVPGTLQLGDAPGFQDEIGSPDVHVDHDNQQIIMYFHGSINSPDQRTGVAFSDDGINFVGNGEILGDFYFRVFQWNDMYYAIGKKGNESGRLWESVDGVTPFTKIKKIIPNQRHVAVALNDNILFVFFSLIGDVPERIRGSTILLEGDPETWKVLNPMEILEPEMDYEGIQYPLEPSKSGGATGVRQLRDPGYFEDIDGQEYLVYTCAGEEAIAIAELKYSVTP